MGLCIYQQEDQFSNYNYYFELKAGQLLLTRICLSDAENYAKYLNNQKVIRRYSNSLRLPFTIENAINYINSKIRNYLDYSFSIKLESNPKETIGEINLSLRDYYSKKYWIGYWLGEPFWGKHIMTEAIKAILKFAFDHLKVEIIESGVFSGNPASVALLKKFKFRLTNKTLQSDFIAETKEVVDNEFYELKKEEYFEDLKKVEISKDEKESKA